jgi:hypothetical protein
MVFYKSLRKLGDSKRSELVFSEIPASDGSVLAGCQKQMVFIPELMDCISSFEQELFLHWTALVEKMNFPLNVSHCILVLGLKLYNVS